MSFDLVAEDIVDQLATLLETALAAASRPDVVVVRGVLVQRAGQEEARWSLPSIVIIPGEMQRDEAAAAGRASEIYALIDPAPGSDPEDDLVRVVMRRGRVELPVEIWIYTQTRADRLPLYALVEAVLQPFDGGEGADLRVTLPNSYNSKARIMVDAFEARDQETQEEDFAAARWRATAAASILSHMDRPKITATVEDEED